MSNGQDVGDVYNATLERIRAQGEDKARLGMEAIMWIAYSERPLEPDELCQALGIEIGSTDLDNDNVPSIRTILNCGLGLVTVDSLSSKARLVHFTLQEHILANPTVFCSPHSMMAEVCLAYLNFECVRELPPTCDQLPPTTPFLEYASRYWGAHARRQTSTSVVSLALKLFDRFNEHISCELLFRERLASFSRLVFQDLRLVRCTALHAGAIVGVLEIMVPLLKINKWDLNAIDDFGSTALLWATWIGHDAIVKVLLEQEGIDPHIVDPSGRTLLSSAAENGHAGIAEMLLKRNDVNPDGADNHGRTPLSWAAGSKVIKALSRGSDVDFYTMGGGVQVPFSFPTGDHLSPDTKEGCERVVMMLLERRDVNPDSTDKSGRTPLSWAAGGGLEKIVRILLERNDVNPDTADENGRTPLSWAAEPGVPLLGSSENYEVVKMLLGQSSVNPDSADKSGRTPLSWAAGRGYDKIVRILLERNDVDPDTTDENGRTPLSWAAGLGIQLWGSGLNHERVVKMLLGQSSVNPDSADKSGRTPLSWAAESGCEEIIEVLLEQRDVNPDRADGGGRTPLSFAEKKGHKKIVGMLLQLNDAHPDTADESGQASFPCATGDGCGKAPQGQVESDDLTISRLGEELSKPSTDLSPCPEPPLKKIRLL